MKKFLLAFVSVITLLLVSCNSWMKDDDFYSDIEHDVKVANAHQIDVYVRYAMTKQGKTDPDGTTTFKVEIPHAISAITETEYGFVKWAAFTTEFLATGDQQARNKDFIFIDQEDYNTRFLPHEIPSPIVVFENPYAVSTTVTVNQERNDIFIVPVVTQRPGISLTIPAVGSSNVVMNMAVRISFSKPMDRDSFKNEEGTGYDKITVTQGNMVITSEGDIDVTSEDITNYFEDPQFSTNSKMITLMFKTGEDGTMNHFKAQSTITVTISKDVKDTNGFSMADDQKVSFSVGSSMDSYAPRIKQLTAGVGDNILAFTGMYADSGTASTLGGLTQIEDNRGSTEAPMEADDKANNRGLYNPWYANTTYDMFTYRVTDKVILRVLAEDITDSETQTGIESDVRQVGVRAQLLYNNMGNPVDPDAEENFVAAIYKPYSAGTNNTESLKNRTYTSIITNAYHSKYGTTLTSEQNARLAEDKVHGALYEIDLASLPDGLIRVDVASIDSVQNNGFLNGGIHAAEYGNGFASVFVVKDTHAPSASDNASKVDTTTTASIMYDWFNQSNYNTIKVVQKFPTANPIVDFGHEKLRSPNANVKWIVKPTSDTSWGATCSKTDSAWKSTSLEYEVGSNLPPDGAVQFTYMLMDDLQNATDVQLIDTFQLNLDTTAPVVNELKWFADAGVTEGIATGTVIDTQTLDVNFTEVTAGVKTLSLNVRKGTETSDYSTPFASSGLTVSYIDPATGVESTIPSSSYTITGNKIVFNDYYTTGHLRIKGVKLSDSSTTSEGSYSIKVKLEDRALNTDTDSAASNSKQITLENDSTNPIVQDIYIPGIKHVKTLSTGDDEYWISSAYADNANQLTTVPVTLTIKENNSGIQKIALSNVTSIANSRLYIVSDTGIETDVSNKVTIDNENKTFTVNNAVDAFNKSCSTETFKLKITDVTFSSNPNGISVVVSDVAKNNSAQNSTISSDNSVSTANFKSDYSNFVPALNILDRGAETGCVEAEAGYTSEQYVDLTVASDTTNPFSGIYEFELSQGATFVTSETADKTKLFIGSTEFTTFVVSSDHKKLTIKNSNTDSYINGTVTITIKNVLLADGSTDGAKSVKLICKTVSQKDNSTASPLSIILDTVNPLWPNQTTDNAGDGIYIASSNDDSFIYPHPAAGQPSYGQTFTGDANRYFYTSKSSVIVSAGISDANPSSDYLTLSGITGYTTVNVSSKQITTSNSTGQVTAKLKDKAGRVSTAKTFVIVNDTTGPNNKVHKYMTIETPDSTAKILRSSGASYKASSSTYSYTIPNGNTGSMSSYSYTIKKPESGNYKIVIKLNGTGTDSKLIDGSTTTTTTAYADRNVSTTSSPLEYYSISHYYGSYSDGNVSTVVIPAFPSGTVTPTGMSINSYFTNQIITTTGTLTSNISWHKYEPQQSGQNNNTDGYVESYVDADGNIVILLPQEQNVPCLSLLLKDGCGNLNFALIDSSSDANMDTDNVKKGSNLVSWTVDTKIGNGYVENGAPIPGTTAATNRNVNISTYSIKDTTASVVPSSTENGGIQGEASGSVYKCTAQAASSKYSNGSGNSKTGFVVKNLVKNTSYYNDKAILCLTIPSGKETVTFSENNYGQENVFSSSSYTVKSRILAVPQNSEGNPSSIPVYSDFYPSSADSRYSKWSWCQVSNTVDINMFNYYPQPNYTALGWEESKPYYLFYIVEDAVGNYEINTIVNDSADLMNLWLYDNTAPKVTLRGTTTDPGTVSLQNINTLVPNNNGYRAYYPGSGTTGYVSVGWDTTHKSNRGTKNTNEGTGTRHSTLGGYCDGHDNFDTSGLLFFDLDVSESTGIRSYVFNSDSTPPLTSKIEAYINVSYSHGEYWFMGDGYNSSTKYDLAVGEDANTYYASYCSNSNAYCAGDPAYDGKWSGVKVGTVMPVNSIGTIVTPRDIYLHVMDWTGNVSTYKMGDFQWVNDRSGPGKVSNPSGAGPSSAGKFKVKYNSDLSQINIIVSDLQGYNESNGTLICNSSNDYVVDVNIPDSLYTAITGIYGCQINGTSFENAWKKGDEGHLEYPYVKVQKQDYNGADGPANQKSFPVYIYDNVGNSSLDNRYKLTYDVMPPLTSSRIGTSAEGTHFYAVDYDFSGWNNTTAYANRISTVNSYSATTATLSDINISNYRIAKHCTVGTTMLDSLEVLRAKAKKVYGKSLDKFEIAEYVHSNDATVELWVGENKSTGFEWTSKTFTATSGILDNRASLNPENQDGNTVYIPKSITTYANNSMTLLGSETFYCVRAKDDVGNYINTYYMVQKDESGPVISNPTCTNVNTIGDTNYFGTNAKISYSIEDSMSGLYEVPGETLGQYVTTKSVTDQALTVFNINSSKNITISAKDNLKNSSTPKLTYNNKDKWVVDTVAPVPKSVSTNSVSCYYNYWNSSWITDGTNENFSDLNKFNNNRYGFSVTNSSLDKYVVKTENLRSFKFKPEFSTVTDKSGDGWYIVEKPAAGHTVPTFVSWTGVEATGTEAGTGIDYKIILSGSSFQFNNFSDKAYLFYPIDYAGNVGTPIEISFIEAIQPVLTIPTTGDTNIITSSNKNYFNANSKKVITVTNPSTKQDISITGYKLTYGSGAAQSYTKTLTNSIKIDKKTSTENSIQLEIDFSEVTGADTIDGVNLSIEVLTTDTSTTLSLGTFKYDATCPAFSLNTSSITGTVGTDSGYAKYDSAGEGNNLGKIKYGNTAGSTIGMSFTPASGDTSPSITSYYAIVTNSTTAPTAPDGTETSGWGTTISVSKPTSEQVNDSKETYVYIYAKDQLGNISNSSVYVTLLLDEVCDPITGIELTSGTTTEYINTTTNTLYYSGNSASFTVQGSSGSGISGYRIDAGEVQTTTSFSTTINDNDVHYIYVIDDVKNVSTGYPLYIKKDSTKPVISNVSFNYYDADNAELTNGSATATAFTTGNDGPEFSFTYAPNLVKKVIFTVTASDEDSGIKKYGYADGDQDATINWNNNTSNTIEIDLSGITTNTIRLYVQDNVGNKSQRCKIDVVKNTTCAVSFGTTNDLKNSFGAFEGGTNIKNTVKTIKGVTAGLVDSNNQAVTAVSGYDRIVDSNTDYETMFIPQGTNIKVSPEIAAGRSLSGYAVTVGKTEAAITTPETFTPVSEYNAQNGLIVPFPATIEAHEYIFLWFIDDFKNTACYCISNEQKNWWLYKSSPTEFTEVVSTNNQNVTITISDLGSVPIEYIEIVYSSCSYSSLSNQDNSVVNFYFGSSYYSVKTKGITQSNQQNGQYSSEKISFNNPYYAPTKIEIKYQSNGNISSIYVKTKFNNSAITKSSQVQHTNFLSSGFEKLRSVFTSEGSSKNQQINNVPELTKAQKKAAKAAEKVTSAAKSAEKSSKVKSVEKSSKVNLSQNASIVPKTSVPESVVQKAVEDTSTITMEASAIPDITSAENEIKAVSTDSIMESAERDYTTLIYTIIALTICAVIAMVIVVNKIIIDKTR